jgi:hypothetical protein
MEQFTWYISYKWRYIIGNNHEYFTLQANFFFVLGPCILWMSGTSWLLSSLPSKEQHIAVQSGSCPDLKVENHDHGIHCTIG